MEYSEVVIITRSPLRISLGGGGTDLPSYYEEYGGFLMSASIDKYVYVNVIRPFNSGIYLKYSKIENVKFIDQIEHPIIREVLGEFNLRTPQIEITTLADIPSGTGLGSSGSFTTALIKALYSQYKRNIYPNELAELACKIEIERLKEPIGKQDQYAAAIGGITTFDFNKDGSVTHSPLDITMDVMHELEDNLLLFYTGISRSASSILLDQNNKSKAQDSAMSDNLHIIKSLGKQSKKALLGGDCVLFGELMNEHWKLKRERSNGITNSYINDAYDLALKNGAVGGKLVGAGGGGFLMFYAKDKQKLRNIMRELNFPEVRFQFDFEGTKVILSR
jgi:D-glycero-alpha-D-manno-heptose-7-phosphate kinase